MYYLWYWALGYSIFENLEIDHMKKVADLGIGDLLLKDIDSQIMF
jgi:hypothetical protein